MRKIKSVTFLAILVILIFMSRSILANPRGTAWAVQTGMKDIHKYKNSYDVCFFGTSMAIANICNQELYEKYGIAGVSVGEPEQPIYLTKFTLRELLKYQTPRVVFLDTRALFYLDEDAETKALDQEDYIVHNSIDGIKTLSVKKEALKSVRSYNEELDLWSYYSTLYYAHENWKNLTKYNFLGHNMYNCMNGNVALFGVAGDISNMYELSEAEEVVTISEEMEQNFAEMVELCNASGTEMVLITGYVDFTKAQHKAMDKLAEKYHVRYIDINEYITQIGFLYNLDLNDNCHFNLSGAVKWTDFLGEYLQSNYEFADRRDDSSYKRYENQSKVFHTQRELIYEKQVLLQAITFDDYLAALNELNTEENIIFLSVYDEATANLTEKESALLLELGLNTKLEGRYRCSYAAVICDEEVREAYALEDTVEIVGNIGELSYRVTSGGLTSGGNASILLNEIEMIQKGRGFNCVVYNIELDTVISSVYFDTCGYQNPPQCRIISTGNLTRQYETGANIWEDIE